MTHLTPESSLAEGRKGVTFAHLHEAFRKPSRQALYLKPRT
eukprot:SAG22_NODE_18394_length_288_cov_0.809524_2_plen_40_part_01